ncbi:GspH/FimT family pseudopilin [Thalassotalea crassostreae]|uniref:GspH/FimT family pseudopilin n=1 Tax=Thalassotalea crassostreae TaxID=1763536 RepID=UPI000837DDEE|nr:GspH/FimT family pseudopilin [Thalassotalea crassostreae]
MKKVRGVTLIELLITILVLSILAGVAGPSFVESFKKRKVISAAEEMYSYLQQARSESLARSANIYLTVRGMTTTTWSYGLSYERNCNPNQTSNISSTACVLTIDDGDGVFKDNPDDSTDKADDNVIFRVDGTEHDDITMSLAIKSGSTKSFTIFDPARGTSNGARNFSFTNDEGKSVVVQLSLLGTVKICSNDYSEYKACS